MLYELKNRLFLQEQEETRHRRSLQEEKRAELAKMRADIAGREERRKLLEEIEREKERGLLIERELRERKEMERERVMLSEKLSRLQREDEGAEVGERGSKENSPER